MKNHRQAVSQDGFRALIRGSQKNLVFNQKLWRQLKINGAVHVLQSLDGKLLKPKTLAVLQGAFVEEFPRKKAVLYLRITKAHHNIERRLTLTSTSLLC